MEYPPISHLISATFNELNQTKASSSAINPAKAPQMVANAPGMGETDTLGVGSGAVSGTNQVGTVLDTVA